MSRIGKLPIAIPENVEVEVKEQIINITGPHGKLVREISSTISIQLANNFLTLKKRDNSRFTNQLYGLSRTLINNMIIGVSKKFDKTLMLEGVGYRAQIVNKDLVLNLGFSHPVLLLIPDGIEVVLEKNGIIIIRGFDKELVGQFAATIKSKRPPEPYKGKGILFKGEIIKRKVGKSGK
uniref:Large ribosomal subunit protein uL6c n=1 Tax=Dictyopteris divaricata TaxID=156996 RepID=A0A2I4Q301_9PHAE|nr:50S ribosomal protein L6 [Dictyopteris divaricata]YP_010205345.1 50S ribosomal protein L6 [Grateloupia livida]AQZ25056.1 50S ribosomal protein L6 [Dictyopteris divaricata]UAV85914.1 50S ribosomal protein L6 [Grateloupia livida]